VSFQKIRKFRANGAGLRSDTSKQFGPERNCAALVRHAHIWQLGSVARSCLSLDDGYEFFLLISPSAYQSKKRLNTLEFAHRTRCSFIFARHIVLQAERQKVGQEPE
jgi:hypothetical protein